MDHVQKNFYEGVCQLLLHVCYVFSTVPSNFVYNGKTRSSFFTISYGVRQGGILSQKLFSVYMDDLSHLMISLGIGCFLDKVCFNHVFYEDDLCLIAPCAIALQELLNKCHRYSITVDVNFNALKSFCVAFTHKLFKLRFPELNINAALICCLSTLSNI